MAKPERTFTGQEGQRSTGTAGPEAIKYDLDNLFAALNPDSSFKDGSPGGLGPENFKAQAADDHAIGDREIDDSLNPEANSGRLTLLLSWLGNMIKKVTGESSWRSTPATTLKVAKQHIDASAPHSGHVKSINAIQGGDITLKAGTNVIIGQNAVTKEVTISTSGTIAPSAHASSHSTSGGDRITPAMIGAVATEAGKGLSTNDFTTTEKNKLAGIEAGAQKNTVTSVAGKTGAVTVTKADVGLGSVQNYGIATKAQAEAGTSNSVYMTPLRTMEAFESFRPILKNYATGTYSGNNEENRFISVGNTPAVVVVAGKDNSHLHEVFGIKGNSINSTLEIVEDGFIIKNPSSGNIGTLPSRVDYQWFAAW